MTRKWSVWNKRQIRRHSGSSAKGGTTPESEKILDAACRVGRPYQDDGVLDIESHEINCHSGLASPSEA